MQKTYRYMDLFTNTIILIMLVVLVGISFNYNTKYVMSDSLDKPIYHGDENSDKVSIMINVYWGTEYIEPILNVLDRYSVKITFFVGGSWVEKNQETLRSIYDRGHEIGNHGFFHKDQDKLSYDANYNEIEPNNLLIEKTIGVRPILFAPPSGAFNKDTIRAASALNMNTIMWSKDTIDWRDKNTSLIYTRATKNSRGGDLILAHPTKNTLEALPQILSYYRDNGLKCVKVSENIGVANKYTYKTQENYTASISQ